MAPVKKGNFGFWIFEKCTLTFAESAREFALIAEFVKVGEVHVDGFAWVKKNSCRYA